MPDETDSTNRFTKEMMDTAVRIWARSSISLIDVRYKLLDSDKPMQSYRMPTNMLVYIYGGTANVKLDHIVYQSERFGVFHGGKGTELSIHPASSSLETYMVLYKAETPPFYKREIYRLLERMNPFIQAYGFSPENPIFFMEKFLSMYDRWNRKSALDQLYAKVVLYQIVHEIYYELEKGTIRCFQPDYVELVKEYLERYYSEPVSIQQLIEMLPVSRSKLARLFKQRELKSFQEYLNEIRLDAAKRHLQHTNATIREIAAGCGFVDELNLIRMFKKYNHMTPSQYRLKMITDVDIYDIDNDSHYPYNERELGRLVKSTGDGELTMFGKTRSKEMIVAAALSLMLLLSACTSAAPANTGSPNSTPGQTQVQTTSTAATDKPESNTTKSVKHVYGETVIPSQPQRIVSYGLEDMLLSLDVPLAQADGKDYDYLYGKMQEKNVPIVDESNYEAILAAQPDLIIVSSDNIDKEKYEQLSQIAPTLAYDRGQWKDSIVEIGQALDREDKANAILKAYNDKLKQARETIIQTVGADKTVALMRLYEKEVQLFFPDFFFGSVLYKDLGLTPATSVTDLRKTTEETSAITLSLEKLPELTADYLFVTAGGSISPPDVLQKALDTVAGVEKLQVWQAIPAVKQDHVYNISARHWMLSGPIADSEKIDDVVEALTGSK